MSFVPRLPGLRAGEDPELLARLPSGFAVLNSRQPGPIRGCALLLPDPVVPSPNDLGPEERLAFFRDLLLLGDAILEVTAAERINYLVLCNQLPELHGHCIPRFATEEPARRRLGPFEAYDFAQAPALDPTGTDAELRAALSAALTRRAREQDRAG